MGRSDQEKVLPGSEGRDSGWSHRPITPKEEGDGLLQRVSPQRSVSRSPDGGRQDHRRTAVVFKHMWVPTTRQGKRTSNLIVADVAESGVLVVETGWGSSRRPGLCHVPTA